ncbi:DUF1549 domain-containing protein, partial [bacterium]|nr:DUF1549 domain-containing protein [bacterium]
MGLGHQRLHIFGLALVTLMPQLLRAASPTAEDLEFFEAEVRPLLLEHCSECHSGPADDAEGGLSFDSHATFFAAEGVAVAGKPEASLLVEVVHYDSDLQMPPDGKLPDDAIATIEAWVRRGLPWPDDGSKPVATTFDIASRKAAHWCWQPPVAVTPPDVTDAAWCRTDLDRFVLARLEAANLSPASEATPQQLIRRAAEVLTGLPPDPADVERVATDPDPLAFDRYVKGQNESNFIDCVAFGKTAELIAKMQKGKGLIVESELAQDRWQDAQGNNKSKVKLVVQRISFPLQDKRT